MSLYQSNKDLKPTTNNTTHLDDEVELEGVEVLLILGTNLLGECLKLFLSEQALRKGRGRIVSMCVVCDALCIVGMLSMVALLS